MQPGHIFTIEPMINEGTHENKVLSIQCMNYPPLFVRVYKTLSRLLTLLTLLTNLYHTAHGLLAGPYYERSQPPKLSTSSTSSTYYIYI